ncbi:hypothetical protein EMCG_01840 [[Emmonsia] crescens]|uniref:Uncharacterized protein n=1 Tax=[Emmonsia] crescens TaxID=73230 RepID=A0A0G2HZZ0_9EURO|nr:hypothetical protein EMCG_01840 [Emmonsia crescens UAMH 3008]
MSTSNQTDPTRTSGNLQEISTQRSSASSQTAASQPTYQEISHWSPDTSTVAASTPGSAPSEHQSRSQLSAGSSPATHRASASIEPNIETINEEKARTASALEHGGPPASPEERTGETYTARMTENPTATQQVSSSGHEARRARRRQ